MNRFSTFTLAVLVTLSSVAAAKDKNANPDILQLQVFLQVRNFRPAAAQVKCRPH